MPSPSRAMPDDETPALVSIAFLNKLSTFKREPSSPTKPQAGAESNVDDVSLTPARKRRKLEPKSVSPETTKGRYKKGQRVGYSSPDLYAHLKPIPDRLQENLDVMWCGINPGIESATSGHAFAHRSNRFWKYLYESGCTAERLKPEADSTFAETHNMAITNIVSRATGQAAELAPHEFVLGLPILLAKLLKYRPKIFACLGKTIYTTILSQTLPKQARRDQNNSPHFKSTAPKIPTKVTMGFQHLVFVYPLEQGKVERTYVFALPSPSGLETHYQGEPSVAMYREVKSLSDKLVSDPGFKLEGDFVEIDVQKWLESHKMQSTSLS